MSANPNMEDAIQLPDALTPLVPTSVPVPLA